MRSRDFLKTRSCPIVASTTGSTRFLPSTSLLLVSNLRNSFPSSFSPLSTTHATAVITTTNHFNIRLIFLVASFRSFFLSGFAFAVTKSTAFVVYEFEYYIPILFPLCSCICITRDFHTVVLLWEMRNSPDPGFKSVSDKLYGELKPCCL